MGQLSSYLCGVEEFVFLMSRCFFNYGPFIGSGIYNGYLSIGKNRDTLHEPDEDNLDDEVWSQKRRIEPSATPLRLSHENPVRADEVKDVETTAKYKSFSTIKLQSPQHTAPAQSTWSYSQKRSESASAKENEDHEHYLKETIQRMRVNYENDESIYDFSEIAGLESVKVALEEFACFFLHFPHLTRKLRQRSTSGILLFGPQGTGKTLLIKSFSKKYNLNLYDIRASAIMSKFVGESEKFVRALFKEVKANAPAVLMLDECDGLLCNPTADLSQSHNYRLLQNELKNQWSDLIHSRDEVIVIGATNKPHDIDMDGFGRRLSLKLHVSLPGENACQAILQGAMSRLRHRLREDDFANLGRLVYEGGLSGYDVDCLVEALARRAIRAITLANYFSRMLWEDETILIPSDENDPAATKGHWREVAASDEEVSYRPIEPEEVKIAIQKARPTVDEVMLQRHAGFASQYGTDD